MLQLAFIQEIGKEVIAGQKAGTRLAETALSTYKGTRSEIIAYLAADCRQPGSAWPVVDGKPIGFNNPAGDGIPEVLAFRSARVILHNSLNEDGTTRTREDKEKAAKRARATKEANRAALINEGAEAARATLKPLTVPQVIGFLTQAVSNFETTDKKKEQAFKAIDTLAALLVTVE